MFKTAIHRLPSQASDMLAGHGSPVLFILMFQNSKGHCLPLQVGPRLSGKEFGVREMVDMWAQADGEKALSHGNSWLPQTDARGPGSQKDTSKLLLAFPMLSNGARNLSYGVKLCAPLPASLFSILHLRGK